MKNPGSEGAASGNPQGREQRVKRNPSLSAIEQELDYLISNGEVAEWLKATVLKTVIPQNGIVGSNPTLTAIKKFDHNGSCGQTFFIVLW